jgi:hypothetical protein
LWWQVLIGVSSFSHELTNDTSFIMYQLQQKIKMLDLLHYAINCEKYNLKKKLNTHFDLISGMVIN